MRNAIGIGAGLLIALGGGLYFYGARTPHPEVESINSSTDTIPAEDNATASQVQVPPEPVPTSEASPSLGSRRAISKGHFEIASKRKDRTREITPIWFDKEREKKLRDIFEQTGSDLMRYVKVQSISCESTVCTVVAESKDGDIEHFQSSVFSTVDNFPWVGNKIDVTTLDAEGLKARFVLMHETAK